MKVILCSATGMVGQGVMRECLRDPAVERVLSIGRSQTRTAEPKLEPALSVWGVSSGGMRPEEYERITYGITLAAAETLAGSIRG
jgi:hypothetical protein